MNKKANLNAAVFIFLAIIGITLFAFVGGIFSAVTNNFVDEVTPIVGGLGVVDGTNFTEINQMTFVPVQQVTQSFNWLFGVLYAVGLLSIIGLAVAFRTTGNGWIIPVFIIMGVLLLLLSILLSNSYEEFVTGYDDIAVGLQEQSILSYLLIYSPIIVTAVFFTAGIIMFTGQREEFVA